MKLDHSILIFDEDEPLSHPLLKKLNNIESHIIECNTLRSAIRTKFVILPQPNYRRLFIAHNNDVESIKLIAKLCGANFFIFSLKNKEKLFFSSQQYITNFFNVLKEFNYQVSCMNDIDPLLRLANFITEQYDTNPMIKILFDTDVTYFNLREDCEDLIEFPKLMLNMLDIYLVSLSNFIADFLDDVIEITVHKNSTERFWEVWEVENKKR